MKSDLFYQTFIKGMYSSLTPENAMKWSHIHPEINKWTTSDMDRLVAFGKANKMRVHGHAFCWGVDVVAYLKTITSTAQLKSTIKDHIYGLVDRYGDYIRTWDVINEAIGDNGKYKSTFFYDKLGDDLIPFLFETANQADPTAEFFISEYGLETNSLRTPGLIGLITQWRKDGMKIHGVSSQMHSPARLNIPNYITTLKQWAATGLKFHISELDITVAYQQGQFSQRDKDGNVIKLFPFNDALKQLSATTYANVVGNYVKYIPKAQQYGITTWSATHKQNYINSKAYTDYPAIFADDYTPEPAFDAIVKAVK